MEIKLSDTLNATASINQWAWETEHGMDVWRVALYFGDAALKEWELLDGTYLDPKTGYRYYVSQEEDLNQFIAHQLAEAWFSDK